MWIVDDLDRAHDAATAVAFDLFRAVQAAQLFLECCLDACLADLVVVQVTNFLELQQVLGAHRSGVAQNVRYERAVLVLAALLDVDLDARKVAALLDDDASDVARHVGSNAHELETQAGITVERLDDVRHRDVEQRRESPDDRVTLSEGKIGRPDSDDVRGNVDRQRPAGAVVDEPACRSDRLRLLSILLGQPGVIAALDNL